MRLLSFIILCITMYTTTAVTTTFASQLTKESLKEYLQENPSIIFDILKEHSVELLSIVIEGSKKEAQLEQEALLAEATALWETEKTKKPFLFKTTERPYLNRKNAPIVMVSFSDFLCPHCAQASETMKEFLTTTKDVKYIFKNYSRNPISQMAYRYFLALWGKAPESAWSFASMIFANQEKLFKEKEAFLAYTVKEVGQNPEEIKKLAEQPALTAIIKEDLAEGDSLRLQGTPVTIVSGRYTMLGAVPIEVLQYAEQFAKNNK